MMGRRDFTKELMLAGGACLSGFPETGWTSGAPERISALVIADAATGRILHRSGATGRRFSPCSTFKLPIALMGFDAGILQDAHHPAWDYRPGIDQDPGDSERRQRTDPAYWLDKSVVWYSQDITRRLGDRRFADYMRRFHYGNGDIGGNPGKHDGLTQSWLMSSLLVSPDGQLAFVRNMLAGRLGISPRATAQTLAIIPRFAGTGGWAVHGKTGSGSLRDAQGAFDHDQPLGWFVGWAEKADRRILFARLEAGRGMKGPGGPNTRTMMLRDIGRLLR